MDNETKIPPPVPTPGNIGELSTHFSYLRRDVDELKTLIKDQKNGYVNRTDFEDHLKIDEDHEKRIRLLEQIASDIPTLKKVVYGAVGLILTLVLAAVIYLVIPHNIN
jgi:hypothetical protein